MVQTFKSEEFNATNFDNAVMDEWRNLVESLNIDGQKDYGKTPKSLVPYMRMNEGITRIFQALCPMSVNYDKYDKSPIPLEVLQEISYSLKESYFTEIKIWYNDIDPDPFAIGEITKFAVYYYIGDEKSSTKSGYDFNTSKEAEKWVEDNGHKLHFTCSNTNRFVIARWGDEAKSLDELKKEAIIKLKDRLSDKYNSAINTAKYKLSNVSANVGKYFDGSMSLYDLEQL